MKHIYIYLGVISFIVLGIGLTGCYKDIISPETDPDGPHNLSVSKLILSLTSMLTVPFPVVMLQVVIIQT